MIATGDNSQKAAEETASSRLDEEFVCYLLNELEQCFSMSEVSPRCPFCGGRNAYLVKRGGNPSNELPKFGCEACGRMFSRRTGSIFSHINRREVLSGFIKQLPQQKSYRLAAQELGCEWRLIWRWTVRVKKWVMDGENVRHWARCIRLGEESGPANSRRIRPLIAPFEPEIMRLRVAGHAIGTIATRLGLNHATVGQVIQHRNALSAGEVLPPRRKPGRPMLITFTDEVLQEVERRSAEGHQLTEIARELNLPYEPLARQRRRQRNKGS